MKKNELFHPDKVIIACDYTDLQRGIEGLSGLVQDFVCPPVNPLEEITPTFNIWEVI